MREGIKKGEKTKKKIELKTGVFKKTTEAVTTATDTTTPTTTSSTASSGVKFILFVSFDGKVNIIENVSLMDTVGEIKSKWLSKRGIDNLLQREILIKKIRFTYGITYNLDNDRLLYDYNIHKESTIFANCEGGLLGGVNINETAGFITVKKNAYINPPEGK